MNNSKDEISRELLDEVASGGIDSALELAEILFKQGDYRLARIFYLIVHRYGLDQATDRLNEIESILKEQEKSFALTHQKPITITSEGIKDELLDKVSARDVDATLELAEILFERGQYRFARIFFLIVTQCSNKQAKEKAQERLSEINWIIVNADSKHKAEPEIDQQEAGKESEKAGKPTSEGK